MDDLEENFDFEDGESANIRLLQFSKDVTFLKLNKILTALYNFTI